MAPILYKDGVISNTADLDVEQVVGKTVCCPACGAEMIFKHWPYGWDADAGTKCTVAIGADAEARKGWFRSKFSRLFRNQGKVT